MTSADVLCRTQTLINKKNFSRKSNNKFRDRPHMIQAEFKNGIEDEKNFQKQDIDFQNGADKDDAKIFCTNYYSLEYKN